jgi:hypothetical protein
MGQIALGQYAYRRGNGLLPSIRLENVFFERVPVNLKDQVALLTRPALTSYATVGTGPIRCVARKAGAFNGDALGVSGESLYRVAPGGTQTLLGTVPGTGVVEIAASPDLALIANGGALLQTDGVTVSAKTFPLSQFVQSVGYINGYFLAVPVGSHRIYYTDLLTGEFDDTRYISAERYPDDLQKIIITSDEVWGMGTDSTEVFVPTGIDTSEQPPFQRVEGRLYKKGLLNHAAAAEADNTVFWVGQSSDGGLAVYRGDAVPVAVSDASVAERIKAADPAAIKLWVFGRPGHSFIVLSLGAQGTWVLDIATGGWYEWGSLNRPQWRAHLGRGIWDGEVLAGDDETGDLWLLDDDAPDDNGGPIRQVWTAGAPVDGRITNTNVSLDCAVGQTATGETASIHMNFSDDQGRTWQDEGECDLGSEGQYLTRARWDRLGQMVPPVRIYEWTTTGRVRMRINGARINDDY